MLRLGLIEITLFYSVIVKPLCCEYLFRGALRAIYWCRKGAKEYIQSTFWKGEYRRISFRSPLTSYPSLSLSSSPLSLSFQIQGCQTASNASSQVAELSKGVASVKILFPALLITFCCDIFLSVVWAYKSV